MLNPFGISVARRLIYFLLSLSYHLMRLLFCFVLFFFCFFFCFCFFVFCFVLFFLGGMVDSFYDDELCICVKIVTVWAEMLFYKYKFAMIHSFCSVLLVVLFEIKWPFWLDNVFALFLGSVCSPINKLFFQLNSKKSFELWSYEMSWFYSWCLQHRLFLILHYWQNSVDFICTLGDNYLLCLLVTWQSQNP